MPTTNDRGRLESSDFEQLQNLALRLEETWRNSDSVNLSDLLPPSGNPLRALALEELIKRDMEIRWRRGQAVALEFYVERHAELGGASGMPARLVYEEFRVRLMHGDRPPLESYRVRFPDQYRELQRFVQEGTLPAPALEGHAAVQKPHTSFNQSAFASLASPTGRILPMDENDARLNGYRLVRFLGGGQFANVYQAVAPGGIPVALKILSWTLDSKEGKRELESLEKVKTLRHPFLVQIHASWLADNQFFVAMSLADGTLKDRLAECKDEGLTGIPPEELIGYFRDAAAALDYLHSQGLIHRDVKPANILFENNTRPDLPANASADSPAQRWAKLADLGLAHMVETIRVSSGKQSDIAGTPAYMAPEAWEGPGHFHSDQYSLAATYAELRQGKPVFNAETFPRLLYAHLHDEPELDGLPPAERQVVRRALSKKPAERYPTCQEFAQALDTSLKDPHAVSGSGSRLLSWKTAAAVLVALLVGVGGAVAWKHFGPGQLGADALKGEVLALVQQGQYSEAHDRILELGDRLSAAEVDELHAQVVEGWKSGVESAIGGGEYPTARALLNGLPERYQGDKYFAVLEKQLETQGEELSAAGDRALDAGDWKQALDVAGKLRAAFPNARQKADDLEQGARRLQAGKKEVFKESIVQAREQRKSKLWAEARASLDRASLAFTSRTEGSELLCEEALLLLEEDHAERTADVAAVGKLIAKLAAVDPALWPPSLEAARADLIARVTGKLVARNLASLDGQRFEQMLLLCQSARQTGKADIWTLGCLAECLVHEGASRRTDTEAVLAEARGALPAQPEAGPYLAYVGALLDEQADKPVDASEKLLEAFKGPTAPPVLWQSPPRKKRAAQVLELGGRRLVSQEADFLKSPFPSSEDAERAYRFFQGARTLLSAGENLTTVGRVQRTLASWYRPKAEREQTLQLLDELATDAGLKLEPREACSLALVRSLALTANPAQRPAAVASYAQAVAVTEKAQESLRIPDEHIYTLLIKPALALEKEVGTVPQAREDLARLHAAKARLLNANLSAAWDGRSLEDTKKEVLAAHDAAVRLHRTTRHVAGWVEARISLQAERNWDELEKDARWLIDNDHKSPVGHRLLGNVLDWQARSQADARRSVEGWLKAVQCYADGIKVAQDAPEERTRLLVVRSTAHVYLARYEDPSKSSSIESHLRQAEQDAREARTTGQRSEEVTEAMGNVLEACAFYSNDPALYTAAINEFRKVGASRFGYFKPWLSVGRCRCKWALSEVANPRLNKADQVNRLQGAIDSLKEALKLDPHPAEAAEAYYWLALSYKLFPFYTEPDTFTGSWCKANECFRRATELAEQTRAAGWCKVALYEWARLALQETQKGSEWVERGQFRSEVVHLGVRLRDYDRAWAQDILSRAGTDAVRNQDWNNARKAAAALEKVDAVEAAWVTALVFRGESNPQEALRVFKEAAPKATEPGNPVHLKMHLDYVRLLRSGDLGAAQPPPKEIIRCADALRVLAGDPKNKSNPIDRATQAESWAESALARVDAAFILDKEINQLRDEALPLFETAFDLAPTHAHGFLWRRRYGELVVHLLTTERQVPPSARGAGYRDEAEKRLREITSGEHRKRAEELLGILAKYK